MSSSKLFVIHQDNRLYTIQTIKHALIVASTNVVKTRQLADTLHRYNARTDRLLNKCRMYQTDCLYICENPASTYSANDITVSYVDVDDVDGKDFLTRLYEFNNLKLFFMEDFDLDESESSPLLSIQGVTLEYTPLSDAPSSMEEQNDKMINYLEGLLKKT